MPDLRKIPLISANQSIDKALQRLRDEHVYALVVSGDKEDLRLVSGKDILQAKARGLDSMRDLLQGYKIASPAVQPMKESEILSNYENSSKLFGKSRARFVVIKSSSRNATLLSRSEEYMGVVSGGLACICNNKICPDHDGTSGTNGQSCPICNVGTLVCY